MKRTLVVGDIHGGLKALTQVFERAAVTTEDKLIFLGDFVDGWSDAAPTISYLVALQEKNDCVFIKGNHDMWTEDWLRTGTKDKTWLVHGGEETVNSYLVIDDEQKLGHLNFFEQMPFYYIDEQNRLFIHAGFTSMQGPQKEFQSSNFSWDRTLWEMAITLDQRIKKDSILYPKRLKLFEEIYIGHTPTLHYDTDIPMKGCNVWNIDTGAAFTGKLTVMDVDSKVFWQSDPVFAMYPGEIGRNRL